MNDLSGRAVRVLNSAVTSSSREKGDNSSDPGMLQQLTSDLTAQPDFIMFSFYFLGKRFHETLKMLTLYSCRTEKFLWIRIQFQHPDPDPRQKVIY